MNLFGLSQLNKLTTTKLLWIAFILAQLHTLTRATELVNQKDSSKIESNSNTKLSSETDDAKSIDFELLSRTGDDDSRFLKDNDPFREILNAEESSLKEVKVEAPVQDSAEQPLSSSSETKELSSGLKLAELKSAAAESTTSEVINSAPLIASSPSSSNSSSTPSINVESSSVESSADKATTVADKLVTDHKVPDVEVKAADSSAVEPVEKKQNKAERLTEEKDPLASASSNVNNVKNEDEEKKEDLNEERSSLDKIESKDLEATHRESDSSELNIEESRQDENTHDQMKLVCYYANWAVYRPGLAKFTPQNINPKLCTHVIYAFGGLSSKYEMKAFDPYNDINQGNYKKFTGLKVYNKNLKTMIAIGGWNEGSKRFSKLVADPELRKTFVDSVVKFLRTHQFDGLDLDWEYPGFRDGSSEDDKDNYVKLIQELREAFEKEGKETGKERLLLSVAVPAGQDYVDNGFDVPRIAKNVDFMNLLTYDYYTSYDPETGNHSPLSAHNGLSSFDDGKKLNVEWTVNYYLQKGAPRHKLVVGLPTYGRSYTLADPSSHDLKSVAEGPGDQGIATREKGYLAYFEICQKIKDENWKIDNQYPKNLGPHAYKDKQWVGYDDVDTFRMKADFILQNGLGGAMIWTLDNDDFRGSCNGQQSPLITALKEALFNPSRKSDPDMSNALQVQPSSSVDKPVRAISRSDNIRKQINSRRPTFGLSNNNSPSTLSTTLSTTTSTTTTTTTTTTTEPPTEVTSSEPEFTTPDPGVDFKCEDEGFFKNPKDCKKYYWCLDSGPANLGVVAHTFTCPTGLFFNPQTEACDYPANVPSCRADKKASKKKQQQQKKPSNSSSSKATTEAPEITTRASTSTTQRANSNNYNLRRKATTTTTTTTTTQAPPTSRVTVAANVQSNAGNNPQITPELLAAALKLAREQEKSASTLNSGPSDDHLFQLLQLVKSLGGIDKVQELLNNYNYNKKPLGVGPIDFLNQPMDVHSHNRHLDLPDNVSPTILHQPNDYASPARQNSRALNRQSTTTISPFLNPSYVTPRRQVESLIGSSPVPDYQNQPSLINDNSGSNNDLDIPRNTQPRQRRPQRIESTTESIPLDQATSSRTRSPFSFVYNEPMLRNNAPVAPANSVYENVDESLVAITEPSSQPARSRSRQRGRTASTSVLIEPVQPAIVENTREQQSPRPRIRGSPNRSNNNNNVANREPANVDGFFLYSTPTRSTRQPNIIESVTNNIQEQPKPRRNQNSRTRTSPSIELSGIGNSYSVPARVTSITNAGVETAPSSSSTRKKKPAKVRISTGFVVNESPASPGVTYAYDEEADIYIPFNNNNNEARSINSPPSRNSGNSNGRRRNENNNARNSFTHHHSHNVLDVHAGLNVPNSIEIPSLNDSPPEPTIISRKPSPIRRRPPQRQHILNNPNALVEGEFSNQPSTTGDLEEPFIRNNNHPTTMSRGTTLNPFSSYNSVGLSSVSSAADIEPTRISSYSPARDQPASNHNGPSIHNLAEDIESNYNLNNGNTDLFNYNNNGNTSPVTYNHHSSSVENNSNDINTTPYLTTVTTERSVINHSLNPTVTESAISSTLQTTTPSPSTHLSSISSSLATTPSSLIRGSAAGGHNLGVRRGRPQNGAGHLRSNSRATSDTTQPSIVQPKQQTPKQRVATSAPPTVTRSPAVSSPAASPVKPAQAEGDPIIWNQADNKVTCNRRGVYVHPQSCAQFVVCAPSKSSIKPIQHHCPAGQVFVKEVGRCKPGDRDTCKATAKA